MFRSILCPTDFSEAAARALEVATSWAEARGASLELLHVLAPPISASPIDHAVLDRLHTSVRREAERDLDALVARARARVPRATGQVVVGFPRQAIAERAASSKADLVVVGTAGRGVIRRALLGSVADRLVRTLDVPILLVPIEGEPTRAPPRVIVAPTDLSAASRDAVSFALDLALEVSASVEVVHAYDVPSHVPHEHPVARALARALREDVRALHDLGTRANLHVMRKAPVEAVAEVVHAMHADLVVMAARGESTAASLLLGGVTDRLLRTCHVPMLVLHPAP